MVQTFSLIWPSMTSIFLKMASRNPTHPTPLGRLIEIRLEGSDVSALMPNMKLLRSEMGYDST